MKFKISAIWSTVGKDCQPLSLNIDSNNKELIRYHIIDMKIKAIGSVQRILSRGKVIPEAKG